MTGTIERQTIWGARYRGATIGFFGLAFMVAYSSAAITTAMPRAADELHGLPLYGLAFAVTMATSVVTMTIAAAWIDRVGPQKPLLTGVAIYVAGLTLAAAAPTMEALVAARALQGIGTGFDSVALYVAIARVFPARLRPKMFGALAAAWVLPSIVGPALSGIITDHFGWRWVFATVPVLATVAAVVVYAGTRGGGMNGTAPPEATDDDGTSPTARKGAGLGGSPWRKPLWAAVAAASVLALGDASARTQPWWAPELAAAVVLLAISVPRLLPTGTWRAARGLPALVLMRGLLGTAFSIADVYLPLLMIDQRDLPASLAGLSLTVGGVTWSIGAWLAGRGTPTPAWSLRLGALGVLLGLLIAALVLLPAMPVWIAWAGWAAAGLGIGLAYPTQSVLVLAKSAPHEQGRNSSALALNETLTTAAALSVVGALFAALLGTGMAGYGVAFAAAVLLASATVAVSWRA
ncbi:MFS transporter [Specibacter cremeus]|uniref:MFS transporter n=1 Tax=Specibacter cremeus TaxID=1629051 RepID=UPI000F79A76D|nr:MFS transporter [Specibacter cremeus]